MAEASQISFREVHILSWLDYQNNYNYITIRFLLQIKCRELEVKQFYVRSMLFYGLKLLMQMIGS
jgi:hypothetical protein